MKNRTFEDIQKEIAATISANPGSIWLMGEGVVFPTKEMARANYNISKSDNWVNDKMEVIQHLGNDYYKICATNVWD